MFQVLNRCVELVWFNDVILVFCSEIILISTVIFIPYDGRRHSIFQFRQCIVSPSKIKFFQNTD